MTYMEKISRLLIAEGYEGWQNKYTNGLGKYMFWQQEMTFEYDN